MIILFLILILATLNDLKKYHISNKLILTGFLSGIISQIIIINDGNIWYYMVSSIFILVIFFPLWVFHVLGAGDIKLFSIIALFTGYQQTIQILFYALIIGASLSIFRIIIQKCINYKNRNTSKEKSNERPENNSKRNKKTKSNKSKKSGISGIESKCKIYIEAILLNNIQTNTYINFQNMLDRIQKKNNTIHFTIPILIAAIYEIILKKMWG